MSPGTPVVQEVRQAASVTALRLHQIGTAVCPAARQKQLSACLDTCACLVVSFASIPSIRLPGQGGQRYELGRARQIAAAPFLPIAMHHPIPVNLTEDYPSLDILDGKVWIFVAEARRLPRARASTS